jgi:hypothetical protein
VFKEHLADALILLAPEQNVAKLLFQQHPALGAQAIHDGPGAGRVVVLKLGAGTFQKSVVVEQLQSPQHLQLTVAHKRDDLAGTQKSMPVNEPDHGAVAFRELHRGNGGALKAGKSFFHSATMTGIGEIGETLEFASGASFGSNVGKRAYHNISQIMFGLQLEQPCGEWG